MKRLGLDLGSSSIGWALREDNKIEKRGVITFQSGMKKGQTGGYTSPTKDRREARSKRRLIQARKYRKWELLEFLLNEFVPLDKHELETWSKYKNIYFFEYEFFFLSTKIFVFDARKYLFLEHKNIYILYCHVFISTVHQMIFILSFNSPLNRHHEIIFFFDI